MPKIIFRPNPTPPPFVPPVVEDHLLTFRALQNNAKISMYYESDAGAATPQDTNIEYSLDNGQTWNEYTVGLTKNDAQKITLQQGEVIKFRGQNNTFIYPTSMSFRYQRTRFDITDSFEASGDITSLLNKQGGDVDIPDSCFVSFFKDCTGLHSAPNLPSTTLGVTCYGSMFMNCTSLTAAPVLPATTLNNACYQGMFMNCTSLTAAPVLPALNVPVNAYRQMFYGCTSLTTAPTLPATTLGIFCYNGMFLNCTSLTAAPVLSTTTVTEQCYAQMFEGCTSLESAPVLPATVLARKCYYRMFYGCSSLTYVKAMMIDEVGTDFTDSWLQGVPQSGTFVKNVAASWSESGDSGIPTGWTVETATE